MEDEHITCEHELNWSSLSQDIEGIRYDGSRTVLFCNLSNFYIMPWLLIPTIASSTTTGMGTMLSTTSRLEAFGEATVYGVK